MPRRPDVPCSACGRLLWRGGRDYTKRERTCQPCRRAGPTYRTRDKRAKGFVDRWDCAGCGTACERPAVRGQASKWCDTCRLLRANRWTRVTPRERLAIYARDGWTCGICMEPVDRSLIGTSDHWRPSLDHVTPRRHGGSDEPSNLRLAHWWCNSALNDGRAHTVEDFRASA